jgi:ABC-2 type transport system permease protein
VLLPPPVHAETVAGYVQLAAMEPVAIVFAAWATASATATRSRDVISRFAVFAACATIAASATCLGVVIGAAAAGDSVGGLKVAEAGVLLVALATAVFAIGLIVAQVTYKATPVAVGLVLGLFFLNSLSRVFPQLTAARWLSPFAYYDQSAPLPAGGHFDAGGLFVLLAIAAFGTFLAAGAATRRRRPGSTAPVTFEPSRAALLTLPVARQIYIDREVIGAWCVGLVALTARLVAAIRTSLSDVLSLPHLIPGLLREIALLYAQRLDEMLYDVAVLLMAGLVFTFVASWAAEDRDGRLEAVLSIPFSRSAIVLERLAALALVAAVSAALSGLVVALMSDALHLSVDLKRLAEAGLVLGLFGIVFATAGSLLTSWWPQTSKAFFGLLVLAAYLDSQIGAALGLPPWAQSLSPFRLVDDPMAHGIDGGNVALALLLTLAFAGSSILAMQRRDVGA